MGRLELYNNQICKGLLKVLTTTLGLMLRKCPIMVLMIMNKMELWALKLCLEKLNQKKEHLYLQDQLQRCNESKRISLNIVYRMRTEHLIILFRQSKTTIILNKEASRKNPWTQWRMPNKTQQIGWHNSIRKRSQ